MASVSAPAKRRSLSRMTSSAPRYSESRSTCTAAGGPMVSTVTRPPQLSRNRSASSSAFRSSGLKMAGRAARLTVPSSFMASPPTLAVSGTCLTRTTMRSGPAGAAASGVKRMRSPGPIRGRSIPLGIGRTGIRHRRCGDAKAFRRLSGFSGYRSWRGGTRSPQHVREEHAAVRLTDGLCGFASHRAPSAFSPLVGPGRRLSPATDERAVTPRVSLHAASPASGTRKATPLVAGATAGGREESLLPAFAPGR